MEKVSIMMTKVTGCRAAINNIITIKVLGRRGFSQDDFFMFSQNRSM